MHDMPVSQAKEFAPAILADFKTWIELTADKLT
jgi:hypothetical protein